MNYNVAQQHTNSKSRNKMADTNIYLNVPFAEKDEAKALGAKWDASNKKWYVPANKNLAHFVKWQTESGVVNLPRSKTLSSKVGGSFNKTAKCPITYATIKDFVPYNGDEPPWA